MDIQHEEYLRVCEAYGRDVLTDADVEWIGERIGRQLKDGFVMIEESLGELENIRGEVLTIVQSRKKQSQSEVK